MSDYLGHLAWYTITTTDDGPTLDVTREDLERWFEELELDIAHLPRATKAVDAFRLATSGVTEEYVSDDGLEYKLAIADHKCDSDVIVRHLMRSQPAATTSQRVANIAFYRPRRVPAGRIHGTEEVKVRLHAGLRGVDRDKVQELMDQCLQRYERGRREQTPHRVRGLLRDYLAKLGAVPFAPGAGIYFVPAGSIDDVSRLQAFVSRCGPDCRMTTVPLVDTDEYREMMREAVELNVNERARKALLAISTWREGNPGKPPTQLLLLSWVRELQALQEQVLTYGTTYGFAFPLAAESLEDLQAVTDALGRRPPASARR